MQYNTRGDEMNKNEWQAAVTEITDKTWAAMMRRSAGGITSPLETGLAGVVCTGGDTRERLYNKVYTAARTANFDDIRAALAKVTN
jgi:hypothetical protein